MKIDSKKVLVTGSGGFIGSHLVEALVRRGCKVRAILHYDSRSHRSNLEFLPEEILSELEIIRGDVCDPHFMIRTVAGCDVVFHLAALIAIPYSHIAPASFVSTNVMGTLNVLEACRVNDIEKMIHTSTSECYGTALYTPIDEDHPLQGQSPYSASKIGADKIAESFYLSFGTRVAILRPFNTFGPRQSARAVIPTILSALQSGKSPLALGSLEPVRDMNYVSNTIEAFLKIAECEDAIGEVINAGSGRGLTIGELAAMSMEIVGRKIPIVCDDRRIRPEKSEVFTLICNAEKAARILDWKPSVSLEEGLEITARFIRNHMELYNLGSYEI